MESSYPTLLGSEIGRTGEPEFWDERYKAAGKSVNGIEWVATASHPLLSQHLKVLTDSPGPVLVPLCGKARDLLTIHKATGHVVGIEFSRVAVTSFFQEYDLDYDERVHAGGVTEFHGLGSAEGLRIFQGDFFCMTPGILGGHFAACYDCKAIVALPAELREKYAKHLLTLLHVDSRMLLIATEFPQGDWPSGPPFHVDFSELQAVYGPAVELEAVSDRPLLKDGQDLVKFEYAVPPEVRCNMSYFREVAYAVTVRQ